MCQHTGNARSGIRILLFVLVSSATFSVNAGVLFVHTDHLGTPVAYSNGKGEVVGEEATTPYGESLNPPTSDDLPSYTGHVRDGATELVYMQARYYDPIIGRFISTDPVRMIGDFDFYVPIKSGEEEFKHFNRYWYANGNPYLYIDPDGREGDGAFKLSELIGEAEGDDSYSNASDAEAGLAIAWSETGENSAEILETAAAPITSTAACAGSHSCRQDVLLSTAAAGDAIAVGSLVAGQPEGVLGGKTLSGVAHGLAHLDRELSGTASTEDRVVTAVAVVSGTGPVKSLFTKTMGSGGVVVHEALTVTSSAATTAKAVGDRVNED